MLTAAKPKQHILDFRYLPKQEVLKAAILYGNEQVIGFGGSRGGSKMMPLDAEIKTPFGNKTHGTIKVGDLVNNPDGTVSKVIQVHPVELQNKVTLYFHDGTEAECALSHLWQAWRANRAAKKRNNRTFGEQSAKVVTTETLIGWIDKAKNQVKRGIEYKNFPLVPVTNEVAFNVTYRKRSSIDPYWLGVLLGDGYLAKDRISITSNDVSEITTSLKNSKIKFVVKSKFNTTAKSFNFVKESFQEYKNELIKLDLLGKKSLDKFIPKQFIYNTVENRYALIQGLLDTDGTVDKRGHISFTTISYQLAKDTAFVIRSLGGVVTISKAKAGYKNKEGNYVQCNDAYTLYIKHRKPENLFRLSRKIELAKSGVPDLMFKKIIDYKISDPVLMRCITVDNPNGLYLTNDFIVTHNSFAIRSLAIELGMRYEVQSLIFRRYRDDLLKNHVYPMLKLYPFLREHFNKTEMILFHPVTKNPILKFDYAESENEIEKVGQGTEYGVIFVDEATQSTQGMIEYLFTANRDSLNRLPSRPKTVLTMNPGGPGHVYIKRIFIDKVHNSYEKLRGFYFIQSSVWDNVFWSVTELYKQGFTINEYYNKWTEAQRREFTIKYSEYAQNLAALPDIKKKAFLFGDWNIIEGIFFDEFNPEIHIIRPDKYLPYDQLKLLRIMGGLDYGNKTVLEIAAKDFYNNVFFTDEIYMDKVSRGEKIEIIKAFLDKRGLLNIPIIADTNMFIPDAFDLAQSNSPADDFLQHKLRLIPVSKTDPNNKRYRVGSNDTFKSYLHYEQDTTTGLITKHPKVKFYERCPRLIQDVSTLMVDKNNPDDFDTDMHDHAYDAGKYAFMSLIAPKENKEDRSPKWLKELNKKAQAKESNFYAQ